MDNAKARDVAESLFDRNKRRETEIEGALKEEHDRHAAVVKNMQRLRALRLSRKAKPPSNKSSDRP
jgi:hypothetical protein